MSPEMAEELSNCSDECVICNPSKGVTEQQAIIMQESALINGYAIWPTQTYCKEHFQNRFPNHSWENV